MKEKSRVFSDNDVLSQLRRAMLYACGLTFDEIKRPFVAVVNTFNEMHPGHMHLRSLAERVKAGVRSAGGTPLEFGCVAICDGMAVGHDGMKYVLPSRGVIADSIELTLRAHHYDAAVLIGACDKIIPALLMVAARVNIPTIIVSGGPMLPGYLARYAAKVSIGSLDKLGSDLISGKVPEDIREDILSSCYPCAGACWGMGTANTMACLTEALGLSLPGDGTAPAVSSRKLRLAEQAGEKIMDLLREGITPRMIMNEAALKNALIVDLATGGSLNTVLHLPALAHELGLHMDLFDFDRASRQVQLITNIEPNGPHHVSDLDAAGGIPGVMKTLETMLDGTLVTATTKTVRENLKGVEVFDRDVIRPLENPVHPYGGIAVLRGNLAEDGAVIKQAALKPELWKFKGPARVFNSEEEALSGLAGRIIKGDVIVIRYEGPKGGPGMREMALFRAALKIFGLGDSAFIVTDGRFSGYSDGPCIGYLSPEAADGGVIGLVEDGDEIEIDVEQRILRVNLSDEELAARRKSFTPVQHEFPGGYLDFYSRLATSASHGCILELGRNQTQGHSG